MTRRTCVHLPVLEMSLRNLDPTLPQPWKSKGDGKLLNLMTVICIFSGVLFSVKAEIFSLFLQENRFVRFTMVNGPWIVNCLPFFLYMFFSCKKGFIKESRDVSVGKQKKKQRIRLCLDSKSASLLLCQRNKRKSWLFEPWSSHDFVLFCSCFKLQFEMNLRHKASLTQNCELYLYNCPDSDVVGNATYEKVYWSTGFNPLGSGRHA